MKLPIRILEKTKKYDSGKKESFYYVQKRILGIWFTWTEKVASDSILCRIGLEVNNRYAVFRSLSNAKDCVERIENIYAENYKGNYIRKFREHSLRGNDTVVYINLSKIYRHPNPRVGATSYWEYDSSLEGLKQKIDERTYEKSKRIFKT